ncbi:MAG: SMI1/KNR4 family protein [Verrucomicrobia bacterium]|nr:SMI1/KNR4 family protein [Verrucomicrobiota bacterium]
MFSLDAKQKIQEHIEAMPDALRREPATEEQLREFEANFGAIPADYRWFLYTYGGGHFGSEEVDDIVQLSKSHAKFQRESGPTRGWTMSGVFVIGWDGSGNPFGIETATGRVIVEDHNFGGTHELAPSLEEFMLRGAWR